MPTMQRNWVNSSGIGAVNAVGSLTTMIDTAGLKDILSLLDDIATSDAFMGGEDIEALCDAREHLATYVNATYNEDTNRYTEKA